jgi:predicted RNase H-like nuclease
VLLELGGPSMSAQAFGIVSAVRAVDDAVSPADEDRVVECHPELVLRSLAGHDLKPKRTETGHRQRMDALRHVFTDVAAAVAAAPRPSRPDDAVDALACALGARRWRDGLSTVLGDGSRDRRALPMRIVY